MKNSAFYECTLKCRAVWISRAGSVKCRAVWISRAGSVKCRAVWISRAGSVKCRAVWISSAGSVKCRAVWISRAGSLNNLIRIIRSASLACLPRCHSSNELRVQLDGRNKSFFGKTFTNTGRKWWHKRFRALVNLCICFHLCLCNHAACISIIVMHFILLAFQIGLLLAFQIIRAVGLESVTWDSSRLESVILRLETWLETWAFGLETWLVTWRLGLGLDSRLAANDLDHKSESQVAIMFWPMQYIHAICSHRISRVQYNIETEKYIQGAIK